MGFRFAMSLPVLAFSRTYITTPFLLACPLLPPTLWDQPVQDTNSGEVTINPVLLDVKGQDACHVCPTGVL